MDMSNIHCTCSCSEHKRKTLELKNMKTLPIFDKGLEIGLAYKKVPSIIVVLIIMYH